MGAANSKGMTKEENGEASWGRGVGGIEADLAAKESVLVPLHPPTARQAGRGRQCHGSES